MMKVEQAFCEEDGFNYVMEAESAFCDREVANLV